MLKVMSLGFIEHRLAFLVRVGDIHGLSMTSSCLGNWGSVVANLLTNLPMHQKVAIKRVFKLHI